MAQVTVEKTKKYLVVKIPLQAAVEGRAELSARSQRAIDRALAKGLRDIKAGLIFGPFSDVKSFKAALKSDNQRK
jgi:hypothetical protein